MMTDELSCRLALQFLPHIGGMTIKKLLQHYGSAAAIFSDPDATIPFLKRNSRIVVTDPIKRQVEQERLWLERCGIQLCFYTDADFPKRLKSCSDAPYLFYYQGKNIFNEQKMIAMVGTRSISQYGKDVARKIVEDLKPYHVCVVSGLALGVDTIAHEQALHHQLPTIAVMGAGFYTIYPDENRALARRIVESGGALITEFPYHTIPDRVNFPQRNRIIAGMSDATIVVETPNKGGSVITAHIANSYNRDVFAVPGNIFSESSSGCNKLIRTNLASLAASGSDIAEMMGWDKPATPAVQRALFVELTDDERAVYQHILQHPHILIDDLTCDLAQFPQSKLAALLLQLELKGVVWCSPGKSYAAAEDVG